MKKIKNFSFCLILFVSMNVKAQNEQFSLSEIDPYVSAYVEPFAKAMSVSLSGGWAHTAKTHGKLGFDISFSTSAIKIPSSAFTFNPNSLGMSKYSFPGGDVAPSISGDDNLGAPSLQRNFNTPGLSPSKFEGIDGLGISMGGMVAIQGAIGLPKGTEVMLRFIPDFSSKLNNLISDDGFALEKTGMWGIGVKHDIKQWVPVVKDIPFLQISGMFTFSKFYTGFSGDKFCLDPTNFKAKDNTNETWDNQSFKLGVQSFTGNLLIGASLPVFQPYIGIGFNSSHFKAGLEGAYPIIDVYPDTDPNGAFQVNKSENDPLVAEGGTTNFNFQAGARIKMGFFALFYQITLQDYTMHTAGFAVTFN